MILLNILVLVFEILYYSMFMYYAKGEGKFKRYLLLFSLITIIMMFTGTNSLYSYLIFVLTTLYGLKCIVKTSLYDMFIIYLMLFLKLLIELIISYIIYFLIIDNIVMITLMFTIIKITIIFILKKKLQLFYNYFKHKWNKNNFYIRYIFIVMNFMYVISIAIYILYILI